MVEQGAGVPWTGRCAAPDRIKGERVLLGLIIKPKSATEGESSRLLVGNVRSIEVREIGSQTSHKDISLESVNGAQAPWIHFFSKKIPFRKKLHVPIFFEKYLGFFQWCIAQNTLYSELHNNDKSVNQSKYIFKSQNLSNFVILVSLGIRSILS